ncbi:MAG: class II fructose-bisphosphate aldolase [Candidatus Taylorbacteria bacterium]
MKTLLEYIAEAEKNKVAIGHFNISNIEMVQAVFTAAKKLGVPVIIGASEGERAFFGVKQIVAVVRSLREEANFPVFLNADHTYSFERVKEAIDAGFDLAIIDGAKLSFDENVAMTKKCVEYAKSVRPDILIEGELGYIGQSSKVLDALPEGVKVTGDDLTHPDVAKKFVEMTGIDLLAPAVGNVHGMMRVGHDPRLDIKRIKDIRVASGIPLVLHGGSGTVDEDLVSAIDAGISITHISTELRVAFVNGIKKSLAENPEEVAPYKYMKLPMEEVERVAEARLKLFNKM